MRAPAFILLLILATLKAHAASSPTFQITEYRTDANPVTVILDGNELRFGTQKRKIENETRDSLEKQVLKDPVLLSEKGDECLGEKVLYEISTPKTKRKFCRNQKAIHRLQELVSKLKIVGSKT